MNEIIDKSYSLEGVYRKIVIVRKSSHLTGEESVNKCRFCKIIRDGEEGSNVFEDNYSVGILDHRPLFPGHVLLLPKGHYCTIGELPEDLIQSFFPNVQLLSKAVEKGMDAQGIFVAINNRVSQSIPHLHVHIVPRNKGDGLKGFFWPRQKYTNEEHMTSVKILIRDAIKEILLSVIP